MAIGVDFETFFDKKIGLSVSLQGASRYIRDPRFNAYLISVGDDSGSWAGPLNRFNWDILDNEELVSHNAGFDSKVYDRLVETGKAPKLNIKRWHCSANLTTYLCNRRSLDQAAEFLFGVKLSKSVRGAADGRTWEQMVADGGDKEMCEYAMRDAHYCWKIWNKYSPLWPELERRLSELTIRQGRNGAQIDYAKLELFYSVACKMKMQAELSLPWIEAGRKPLSTKAIAEECRKLGIPTPPVKKREGEEAYDEWARTFAPKHKWVKAYSDYRVIDKFIDQLETIKDRLMDDGCFPFELLYFGAHTGRWAGGGGFNMQNMRKEPLYCDHDLTLITDPDMLKEIDRCLEPKNGGKLPEFVAFALDMRALFTARPGKKMIVSDLSQIEPRVLAWLVKDREMLRRMVGDPLRGIPGMSPYQAHAEATMGWTGGNLKDLDKYLYALAKARVLGLGYGCGWKKFINVAYDMAGLDITKDDPEWIQAEGEGGPCWKADGSPLLIPGYGAMSRKVVTEYRAQNPLIASQDDQNPGIWKQLDNALKEAVGDDLILKLPSGRELRYLDVKRERRAVPDPDDPKKFRHRTVITAMAYDSKQRSVVRKSFYGGLLTENITQATARDIFAEHLLALDDAGMTPLWNVHDEAVTECSMSTTKADVEHVMSVTPEWIPGLPVAAEAKEVKHYLK